jgi:ArsR family transcriptional regulator
LNEALQLTRADFFKALAHPTRLQILELLRPGERCVCEIFPALDMIQPNVSRHLAILKKEGLVQSRKDGLKVIYWISDSRVCDLVDQAAEVTRQIWQDKADLAG